MAWRLEIKQNDLALGCQAVFFANILDHDDDDDINDDEATVSMNAFKHEEVSRLVSKKGRQAGINSGELK